jgi:hypothetical protein
MAELTIDGFARELSNWYRKYASSKYFKTYEELEHKLSQKAISQGYLEMGRKPAWSKTADDGSEHRDCC